MKISMETTTPKRMRLCLLVTCLLAILQGCQETYLIAEDGGVVVGWTMEYAIPIESYIFTKPAGTTFKAHDLPNCDDAMEFKAFNKVIITYGWAGNSDVPVSFEGFNSAGLSASMLNFADFAEYLNPYIITGNECKKSIPQIQVVDYILATYDSVLQLKDDLENDEFPSVWAMKLVEIDLTPPVHYSIIDNTGETLILEYTKGKGALLFNNTIGVVTNSPPYDWHMNNIKNYAHLTNVEYERYTYEYRGEKMSVGPFPYVGTGLLGMPGDYSPPSRFVKAATFLRVIKNPETSEDAIIQTMHMINAADITKGAVVEDENTPLNSSDHTQYSIIRDLKNRCCYFRGYVDSSWRSLCVEDIPHYVTSVPVEGTFENSYRNIKDLLEPITLK